MRSMSALRTSVARAEVNDWCGRCRHAADVAHGWRSCPGMSRPHAAHDAVSAQRARADDDSRRGDHSRAGRRHDHAPRRGDSRNHPRSRRHDAGIQRPLAGPAARRRSGNDDHRPPRESARCLDVDALARNPSRQSVRRRRGDDPAGDRARRMSSRTPLRFPDAGIYWYHPHVREDMQQELGLYGNILVRPPYAELLQRPSNREEPLVLPTSSRTRARLMPFGAARRRRTR